MPLPLLTLLLFAACKTQQVPEYTNGIPQKPNAATLLEYSNDSSSLFAQVLAFHPEYTAFQMRLESNKQPTGRPWHLEMMADALADAPAILSAFEPQETRLNKHTALCMSRRLSDSFNRQGGAQISVEKTIKAFEATGDSLLLFLPVLNAPFKKLRDQNYLIEYNGVQRIVPTGVWQEKRAHLRLGPILSDGSPQLICAWNDFAGHDMGLARYWQFDSLPVLPALFPGNHLDYHYYRPVKSNNGPWEYRSDTFRVQFIQTDTVLRARVYLLSRGRLAAGNLTDFYFNPANAKSSFSQASPFPPLGLCLTDSMIQQLLAVAFASFPSVSNKKTLPAALMLNPQGNHVWEHSCAVNGVQVQLNGFRVQSDDQSLDAGFIVYRQTPFVLSYREGMHHLELIGVCAGKKGCGKTK